MTTADFIIALFYRIDNHNLYCYGIYEIASIMIHSIRKDIIQIWLFQVRKNCVGPFSK